MTDHRFEDARHVDHQELREELEEEFEDRPPGQRTVEINNQRYKLYTLKEYLADPNATTTRWEVFELIALIDQRKRYESRWAKFWRAIIRFVNRYLGGNFSYPTPPRYLKIPLSRIERRGR